MCGIAGLIYRGKQGAIGQEMTAMLQALRHRGSDSTGFALYGQADHDPKTVIMRDEATAYAYRYLFRYDGELRRLVDYIEDIEAAEILSVGQALELIKDLGDAATVCGQYSLSGFKG